MSEQNPEPEATTEEDVTPDATDVEQSTDDAPEADEDNETPDWRKDFDPNKAADRIRKLQSEAKNLRERAKAAEEKAKSVPDKDTRISSLEAENLRLSIGYDLGLPKEIAGRLQGSTRDELIEDAKALVELMGAPKSSPATRKPVEALRGGARPDAPAEETDVRKLGERMFSR